MGARGGNIIETVNRITSDVQFKTEILHEIDDVQVPLKYNPLQLAAYS